MDAKNNQTIIALSVCSHYDFDALRKFSNHEFRCAEYHRVLNIQWKTGDLFLFDYGIIVFWNLDSKHRNEFLQLTEAFMTEENSQKMSDEFSLDISGENIRVKNDHIQIPEDDVMVRLATSHAIAQSTKLAQFEWQIQQTINDTADIPRKIANTGTTQMSRKQLARLRGKLFIAKSGIMLNYDLLDIPEFFWEYPEYEPYYRSIADYLEVRQRVDVLNKKLETIHELLQMLADERKHQHSSLLEWIIIWLIAFEIIVFLFHDIFKVF